VLDDVVRVLDLTTGLAGPYCTKLLADGGADVVKVEPAGGDPLRRRHSGAMFEFLNTGKRPATMAEVEALAATADVVVDDGTVAPVPEGATAAEAVVVSITPFGLTGPWAGRAATEFTLQAWCGSTGGRGTPDRPPVAAGGRIGELIAGAYAAAFALAGLRGAPGARIDVSTLECMAVTMNTYASVFGSFLGWPPTKGPARTIEIPSIEPTADGYVGFTTITAQQFRDFLVLIERPDLLDDRQLATAFGRSARMDEMLGHIHAWTTRHTTAEIIERATLLRIPVAPVGDGETVVGFEQFVARGTFVKNPGPRGFLQPRVPYQVHGVEERPPLTRRARSPEAGPGPRPLAGLRILDFTAFWAGPSATHVLAALGADVVKVESTVRPDGMRFTTTNPRHQQWWEWGPLFHGVNTNKRSVTLDLNQPEGVELVTRLIAAVDAVLENFTPRVLEQFGLDWPAVHAANPRAMLLRMPAFGLDGPWRDRTGFAQTMEQISGLASITGWPDGPPLIPRGACDPFAGMHAVVALLVALAGRDHDGEGRLVEVTMVEAALQAAAESIVEHSASGLLLTRMGNRSDHASPQGVYRAVGDDRWLALAVADDSQWPALCRVCGVDPGLDRWADADAIDRAISSWAASIDVEDAVEALAGAGVPAAVVVDPRDIVANPQLRARGLFEVEDHPVTGRHELPTIPVRMSGIDHWLRRRSPMLGEHNAEVLGLPADQLDRLRAQGVIGEAIG
jgi:crotonobetainyl-CoA:carnitine CoA-transferase CaiB-like acyl-CoA transferase